MYVGCYYLSINENSGANATDNSLSQIGGKSYSTLVASRLIYINSCDGWGGFVSFKAESSEIWAWCEGRQMNRTTTKEPNVF